MTTALAIHAGHIFPPFELLSWGTEQDYPVITEEDYPAIAVFAYASVGLRSFGSLPHPLMKFQREVKGSVDS
jgi:hypothetical protein